MSIRDWPADDRPREKLLARGAIHLTDTELLALFLRTGAAGVSAVDLARELLLRFGSLSGLFGASVEAVCAVPGLGPAKYAQLQAVIEMAQRALRERLDRGEMLTSPGLVKDYLRLRLQDRDREVFLVLFLDAQNQVVGCEELFA
ncbi:MAG: hypothetical protein KIT73_15835, partial [Burkholderiales bacterium]|nr:hypothetical protein [Burkholderiales bacterium]